MGSFRRCLTALVVSVAIGVGSGASEVWAGVGDEGGRASKDHAAQDDRPGRDKSEGHDGGKGHERKGDKDPRHDHQSRTDDAHEDESHGDDYEGQQGDSNSDDEEQQDQTHGDDEGQGSPRRRPGPTTAPTPSPSETPGGAVAASLDVTVRASQVVARVGDEIDYTITITNTGDAELIDVTVLNIVPGELDVTSVPVTEGVAAAQAGRSSRGEDVVWILETLAAGASVDVYWTGVVVQAGDLEATNVVTATTASGPATASGPGLAGSGGHEARASTTTFLATTTGVAARRTAPQVMPKRIVTVTRVTGPAVGPGAPLPVTAMAVEWLVALALTIALAGIVLLIVGRPPLTVGRGSALALALLSVVYAATFIGDSSSLRAPRPAEPRPAETIEDQVKGKRIFKEKATPSPKPDVPEDAARPDEDESSIAAPPIEAADQVEVRTVRTVKVPVDAIPIESGRSANVVGFSWDEPTRTILQATSSLGPITRIPTYELQTSLAMSAAALETTLVLGNLSEEFIAVRGVLVLDLGGEGVALTLRTSRIDVILRPGGEVRATFRYLLPSGAYQAGANFVAD